MVPSSRCYRNSDKHQHRSTLTACGHYVQGQEEAQLYSDMYRQIFSFASITRWNPIQRLRSSPGMKSGYPYTCRSSRWHSRLTEMLGTVVRMLTLRLRLCQSIFQLVLAFDAAIFRNTIQIIGLSIFNGLFLLYAVIQVSDLVLY